MTGDLPIPADVSPDLNPALTDAEVIAFVQRYADENALVSEPITPATRLEDAGLDSLSTAELLLSARAELVAAGRLDPDSSLVSMPILTTVADLGGLIRTLGTG